MHKEQQQDHRGRRICQGEEELCKINEIFAYRTIEEAFERVKAGFPVIAVLLCFDGWSHTRLSEDDIYNGPKVGAKYNGDHQVIIFDFKEIKGKKVAICNISNGLLVGYRGFLAVNLEVMVMMVCGTRFQCEPDLCPEKPTHLLKDFWAIDTGIGKYPLITLDEDQTKEYLKNRVVFDSVDNMKPPKYQNRAPPAFENGVILLVFCFFLFISLLII